MALYTETNYNEDEEKNKLPCYKASDIIKNPGVYEGQDDTHFKVIVLDGQIGFVFNMEDTDGEMEKFYPKEYSNYHFILSSKEVIIKFKNG